MRAAARIVSAASVIVDEDGNCDLILDARPCAETTVCAAPSQPCRGPDVVNIIPCCEEGYNCIRQNREVSRCLLENTRLPTTYDGTIEEVPPSCRAGPA